MRLRYFRLARALARSTQPKKRSSKRVHHQPKQASRVFRQPSKQPTYRAAQPPPQYRKLPQSPSHGQSFGTSAPPQQPFQWTAQQPGQFQPPPLNQPKPPLSTGKKILLAIGLFFGILFVISAIIGISTGTQQAATSDQNATATAVASSSTPTSLSTSPPNVIGVATPTAQRTAMAKPTPTPTAKPLATAKPTPKPATPTACPGINCNPWGYNFTPGSLIYNPPSNFCSYFNCIASFWEPDDPGDGYVVQCADGLYSQSGGERGACSYHGGVSRPLYAH